MSLEDHFGLAPMKKEGQHIEYDYDTDTFSIKNPHKTLVKGCGEGFYRMSGGSINIEPAVSPHVFNIRIQNMTPDMFACPIIIIDDIESLKIYHECIAPEHTLG
jgi:hypothetical protein